MNRPFAYIGFSYLLGLLVAFSFSTSYLLILSAVLLLSLILLFILRIKLAPTKLAIFGFVLGISVANIAFAMTVEPYQKYINNTHEIHGEIDDFLYESYGTSHYKVEVMEIDGEKLDNTFHVSMSSYFPIACDIGDHILGEVEFTELRENTDTFYYYSAFSDGYSLEADLDIGNYYVIENNEHDLSYYITMFRKSIEEKINVIYSEDTADIISALILGDRHRIDDDIYDMFTYSGANHILVVSGMHLSIIMGLFMFAINKIDINRKVKYFTVIPFLLMYILISGMGLSVVRSGIMMLILIISLILGEEADAMNSLGFAVLMICLVNPFSSADFGFLLSVSATAGIVLLSNKISEKLKIDTKYVILNRVVNSVTVLVSVSVSAFLFVMPIILYMYGSINPLSIITGTILALPTTALLTLAFISVIISFIPVINALTIPLTIVVNLLVELMIFVTNFIGEIGKLIPVLPENRELILFIGIMLSVGVFLLFKTNRKTKVIFTICMCIMIISSYVISFVSLNTTPRIITVDAGAGSFAFIPKGDKALVISGEGYSTYEVNSALKEYGIEYVYSATDNSDVVKELEENYDVIYIENGYVFEDMSVNIIAKNEVVFIDYDDIRIAVDNIGIRTEIKDCDILIAGVNKSAVKADTNIINMDNYEKIEQSGAYINTKDSIICVTLDEKMSIRSVK